MKKQNKRDIKGNKKKLSSKIKNQTQSHSNRKFEIRIAETLDEALANSDRNGLTKTIYKGIMYIKPAGEWIGLDVTQRLLDFPAYKEIKAKYDGVDELTLKDVLLTLWVANAGTNTKYDIDIDTLLSGVPIYEVTK